MQTKNIGKIINFINNCTANFKKCHIDINLILNDHSSILIFAKGLRKSYTSKCT